MLTTSALYGRSSPLKLPITSITEEFKAGKIRTVMTLRYSRDEKIKKDPPEVRTRKKWSAETTTDDFVC